MSPTWPIVNVPAAMSTTDMGSTSGWIAWRSGEAGGGAPQFADPSAAASNAQMVRHCDRVIA
jgi:hypothetical protein